MDKIKFSEISGLYPFEPKFFKIKDYVYHYVDEGAGNPIVMLHGNPSWSFCYRNLIKDLSRNYRVIAPDNMGCGLSDKPIDYEYTLETHIENLESLLLTLNLEDITLVMHGAGGPIGMGFAIRYPQRIKSLIMLNTSAFSFNSLPWRFSFFRLPWIGKKLVVDYSFFCKASLSCGHWKNLDEAVKKGYFFPYQSPRDRLPLLEYVNDIPTNPVHRSYEVLLQIEHGLWMFRESPVCVIWGLKDFFYSHKFLERWAICYPQAHVHCLKEAGFYLLEEEPDRVAFNIKSFLSNYGI